MKNTFNHNDVNQGWQAMRQTLDREMPQKRRRLLGWWWIAAGLVVSGVGGLSVWQQERAKSVQPPVMQPAPVQTPAASQPVVVISSETGRALATVEPAPAARYRLLSPTKNAGNGLSITPTGSTAASTDLTSGSLASITRLHPAANTGNTNNGIEPNPDGSLAGAVDAGQSQGSDPAVPVTNTLPSESPATPTFSEATDDANLPYLVNSANEQMLNDFQHTRKTDFLNSPLVGVRSMETNPISPTALPSIPVAHTISPLKIWNWGVMASIGTEQWSLPNTASVGIVSDWSWPSKIGLRLGLGYTHAKPTTATRPLATVWALEYAEAANDQSLLTNNSASPSTSALSLTNSVIIPARVLHRIEVPVLFFWQPKRNIRLYGGVVANYTLHARAARQRYATDDAYLLVSPKFARSEIDDLVTSKLPNWSSDWQVGLGIHLTRNFELGLGYKRSLRLFQNSLQQEYRFSSLDTTATGLNLVQYYNRQLFSLQGTLFF